MQVEKSIARKLAASEGNIITFAVALLARLEEQHGTIFFLLDWINRLKKGNTSTL